MKILVVGAGGLGGYFGGLLAQAGEDVTFLARGETLRTLQSNGLTVRSSVDGDFTVSVNAVDHIKQGRSFDHVFFSVKSYDLEQAANSIVPFVNPGTTVLAVQNGIEHPRRLGEIFGTENVLPIVVYVSSTVRSPGVIEQIGDKGWVQIGELNGRPSHRVTLVADALRRTGVSVGVHEDIWRLLWTKFVDICAFSGVTALTRITFAEIISIPELRAFYLDVMTEGTTLAQASGINLPDDFPDRSLAEIEGLEALPERGSMAYDLLAGRRLEIDTLNGSAVRLGKQYGLEMPLNRAIVAALLPHRDGAPDGRL